MLARRGLVFEWQGRLLPVRGRNVEEHADLVERQRGHVGTVYRAFNGKYVGRSSARTMVLSRDGRCVSERALSKIRGDEQGAAYALRQLREIGAPARRGGEHGDDYVARALDEGGFRKVRHPGNLTFTWRLSGR